MDVVLVIMLIAALVIAGIVYACLQQKRRREAFQRLARELGLEYVARDDVLPSRYEFLDALREGDDRYAFNILRGRFEGHPVQAFDYHYETESTDSKGNRETEDHYFSFFLLDHERSFPELRIYREGFWSKVGQFLGYEDIDFESIEFSKAFCVRSRDRKFAYDICHARMMEYLLAHRDLSIEIEGHCVALSFSSCLKPEQIPGRLRQLVEIRNLFPEYLYRG